MNKNIKIKGGMTTVTNLHVQIADEEGIKREIQTLVEKAPALIKGMPVIIDMGELCTPQDIFAKIVKAVRSCDVNPFAMRGELHLEDTAKLCGLSYLGKTKANPFEKDIADKKSVDSVIDSSDSESNDNKDAPKEIIKTVVETVEIQIPAQTMTVEGNIRSGKQIYARDSDLIIIGNVSPGAEVLADGNIHVYGALRGRAMAGLGGNDECKIFCTDFDAELVSLNGDYMTRETVPDDVVGSAVQVIKQTEKIVIKKL